jgi:hypothetical protein
VRVQVGSEFHDYANIFFGKVDEAKLTTCTSELEVDQYFHTVVCSKNITVDMYLHNWLALEAKRWWQVCRREADGFHTMFLPAARELDLACPRLEIAGKIDRLDIWEDGLILIEYKPAVRDMTRMRAELAFYYLLYECVNPLKKHIKKVGVIEYTKGQMTAFDLHSRTFNALADLIGRMRTSRNNGMYEKKLGDKCMMCAYNDVCLTEEDFASLNMIEEEEEKNDKPKDETV